MGFTQTINQKIFVLKKKIQVLVVDDHQLIIEGLKNVFENESSMSFAGGVNSVEDAIRFIENSPVDVVLTDINMPGQSGIELTRIVKQRFSHIEVLALSMHNEIGMISDAVEAGVSGYLLKRTDMNEVLEAIKTVANKDIFLGKDIQQTILEYQKSSRPTINVLEDIKVTLTSREKEVLEHIIEGLSNQQIAQKLLIREHTVESIRRNILIKTKTSNPDVLRKYSNNSLL